MKEQGVRGDDAFRLLGREYLCRGRFVSVTRDHIVLPGGHETRHEVLHLPSAVSVVPLLDTKEGGPEVVLVEQFRNAVEGYIHEIPAGILEPGEDPAACAARELEEETGYTAARIVPLLTVFPVPGISNHLMYFYLAEGLTPGSQRLEAAECLSVRKFPLSEVVEALLGTGRGARTATGAPLVIVDGKTHIGILHASLRRGPLQVRGENR